MSLCDRCTDSLVGASAGSRCVLGSHPSAAALPPPVVSRSRCRCCLGQQAQGRTATLAVRHALAGGGGTRSASAGLRLSQALTCRAGLAAPYPTSLRLASSCLALCAALRWCPPRGAPPWLLRALAPCARVERCCQYLHSSSTVSAPARERPRARNWPHCWPDCSPLTSPPARCRDVGDAPTGQEGARAGLGQIGRRCPLPPAASSSRRQTDHASLRRKPPPLPFLMQLHAKAELRDPPYAIGSSLLCC